MRGKHGKRKGRRGGKEERRREEDNRGERKGGKWMGREKVGKR